MLSESLARLEARKIILEHASDIEALSISEMLEGLELPDSEHDKLCDAVSAQIDKASIDVYWDDEDLGDDPEETE